MNINTEYYIPELASSSIKQYNEYEIELKIYENFSLNIIIKKNNDSSYYENNFSEAYLQQKFKTNEVINNIYNIICDLIEKKKVDIKINNNNLNFKLKYNDLYIRLILKTSY